MGTVPRLAQAAPTEVEQHLDDGARLLSEGRAAEAAVELEAAFSGMSREDQIGMLGEYAVGLANDAYAEAGSDPELLEANRTLLQRYLEGLDAARDEGLLVEIGEPFERSLRERLVELEERPSFAAEEPVVLAAEGPVPLASAGRAVHVDERARGPLRPLDVGLLAGGGVALAGGLGLAIQGARFPGLITRSRADAMSTYGLAPQEVPPSWNEHERRQQVRGTALLASGIVVSILAAGAFAWGAARVVSRDAKARRLGRFESRGAAFAMRFR